MNELDDLTLIMQGKAGDTAATNAAVGASPKFHPPADG